MLLEDKKLEFPPKSYVTFSELSLKENEGKNDINLFLKTDERLFAPTEGSKIVEYFNGKTIFITGGTGFLGKLLIEKLLRTCKDIKGIFMLIRPKKSTNPEDRIDKTFSDPIFSELEKIHPQFKEKLFLIKGDISLPELNISISDRNRLIDEVNVIFHCAATLRFDEKLRDATKINVNGTKEILNLAHSCKNFHSLAYVSTAFSNCNQKEVYEKFYEPPYTTDEIFDIITKNNDEYLEENIETLLKGWPNTYTLTKAIAENAIKTFGNDLKVCIYRPSIVISTYKEPLKAWIDNLYGPMGAIVGAGTGVLRSFYVDKELVADMIPADFVANGLIAAAYQNQFNRKGEIPIYQCVTSDENPITWGDFHDLACHYGLQYPTVKSIWYYCNTLNKNYYIHMFYVLFLHFLPALLLDGFFHLTGKKTRMVVLYKKIHKFSNVLKLFSMNEWKFHNNKIRKLWNGLSDIDKNLFQFNVANTHFNWNEYLKFLGPGVRIYLIKDDLSTIHEGRKLYKKLYYYHQILKIISLAIFLKVVYFIIFYIKDTIF